jgi:hypothetical protein
MHDWVQPSGIGHTGLGANLEAVLDHEVELFDCSIFPLCPDIQFSTEED